MTLEQLTCVEVGEVGLRALRHVESGRILVSVDKFQGQRWVRGPLLSEFEVRRIVSLIEECSPSRGVRFQAAERRTGAREGELRQPAYNLDVARVEIEEAIRRAHIEPLANASSAITMLSTMPKFRYLHTCSVCGSHVESMLRFGCSGSLKMCPSCKHVRVATG